MASSEKIEFTGHSGDILAARLDLPDGAPRAFAVFAHCFTCSKDVFAAARVSQGLSTLGFAVLRFDFTGLGSSDGEFANTNFSSNVADLLAAVAYLRANYQAPALMIGHSLGGAATLAAAQEVDECKAVVTIGAPSDAAHVAHNFHAHVDEIEESGSAEVELGGRTFTIKKQFLDDIGDQKLLDGVAQLKKALLVCHAPLDETVSIGNATDIFVAAKHPKSFVSLDSADHLLRRREDAVYVADVIAAWASRYVPVQADPAAAPLEDGEVEVSETRTGKYTNLARTAAHSWIADEPKSVGGDDRGPGPYDLLLAGLGACTSMTLRMYANRKKWPLEKVTVRLKHGRIHADDCADCETTDGLVDEIMRTLEVEGPLDEEQRARLLEIADKCPVHKTLENEIKVRTTLL